jgi:molybdate transport system substrate-binding protein
MVEFATMCNWLRARFFATAIVLSFLIWSCSPPHNGVELKVAAAGSLTEVFQELAQSFEAEHGIRVIPSFAATGQLAQQMRNGAPYDLFAAADALHIDALIESGLLVSQSRMAYALGELIIVRPEGTTLELDSLADLTQSEIERIAIANPAHAPYGIAARDALISAGVWHEVEHKIIYGETVKQAAVIVATGNADVGIVAHSVLDPSLELVNAIPSDLHHPVLHIAAMTAYTPNKDAAQQFLEFLRSPEGQSILNTHGFSTP